MIRISLEVGSDTRRLDVTILAESIVEALDLAEVRFPDEDVRVVFPIHPESFFVEDAVATVRPAEPRESARPDRGGDSALVETRPSETPANGPGRTAERNRTIAQTRTAPSTG